jgi:hypothetical protein
MKCPGFMYYNISFREFTIIVVNKWSEIANKYEFESEYMVDVEYWRLMKRNSKNTDSYNISSDSDSTIA